MAAPFAVPGVWEHPRVERADAVVMGALIVEVAVF